MSRRSARSSLLRHVRNQDHDLSVAAHLRFPRSVESAATAGTSRYRAASARIAPTTANRMSTTVICVFSERRAERGPAARRGPRACGHLHRHACGGQRRGSSVGSKRAPRRRKQAPRREGAERPFSRHQPLRHGVRLHPGWGIFDGPAARRSVQAIAAWHVNAVRITLNEDCWLGINGVEAAYGGTRLCRKRSSTTSSSSTGTTCTRSCRSRGPPRAATAATYQPGAPDADHSPPSGQPGEDVPRRPQRRILAPVGRDRRTRLLPQAAASARRPTARAPISRAGMQQAVTS